MIVAVSGEELAAGRMAEDKLRHAVAAVESDGYVVLEGVVSHRHLDVLREKMSEDTDTLVRARRWGGAGRVAGHLQQAPPPCPPYVFRDVVANPFVVQVTAHVLGDGVHNHFYNGNTNTPGSGTQPLHRDRPHLWPGYAHPPVTLVVNISPVDTTEENGSTELWPGTHLDTTADRRVDEAAEAARRAAAPPVRANASKGSALIRDIRLWHRGVPNRSAEPRHMIAMAHSRSWLRPSQTLRFARGCESVFDGCGLSAQLEFTDEPIDYLFGPFTPP